MLVHYIEGNEFIGPGDQEVVKEDAFWKVHACQMEVR